MRRCGGLVFVAFLASFFCVSCINQKDITYFNNLPDTSSIPLSVLKIPQQQIQVNDILNIKIGGESEKTTAYISQYLGGTAGVATGLQFTVGSDGSIDLPKIGKIKVAGHTRDEAKDLITQAFSVYLINPIITMDFNNFKFSILGEVKAPGVFYSYNSTDKYI